VPELVISFTIRPPTVAAAVYGAMTIISEHTGSLARLDDVRIALDELLYATSHDRDMRASLAVSVDDHAAEVTLWVSDPNVAVHESVASLVDAFEIVHGAGGTTATLSVRHD